MSSNQSGPSRVPIHSFTGLPSTIQPLSQSRFIRNDNMPLLSPNPPHSPTPIRSTPTQSRIEVMVEPDARTTTSNYVPREPSANPTPTGPRSRSSVKHLTCYWWKQKGHCRFSEEDCLYAHRDTGHYTEPPVQLYPGEPAKAGKSLDRELRKLTTTVNTGTYPFNSTHLHPASSAVPPYKSSSSLASLAVSSRPITPALQMIPPTAVEYGRAPMNNNTTEPQYSSYSDSTFLRKLLEQANREKDMMLNTIETIQEEKASMQKFVDKLVSEKEKLAQERDALRDVVKQFQQLHNPPEHYGVIGAATGLPSGYSTSGGGGLSSYSTSANNSLRSTGRNVTTSSEAPTRGGRANLTDIFRNLGPSF